MAAMHKLIVGARGWDHPGWVDVFYPADLPQAWRLTYYANEFPGVLLPETLWLSATPARVAGWCEEVADDFLFFLECRDALRVVPTARRYQKLFRSHWGGVPDIATALMPSAGIFDLRALRRRFEVLLGFSGSVLVPAFFLSGDPPDIGRLRQAKMLADML
ncbi:MAG: DUF72 domain-containing protein [Chromatiaceae bacterium]|nr:DUF72 domain-containing protein [Chromatiaceae bacterium]